MNPYIPYNHSVTAVLNKYPRFVFVHTPELPFSMVSIWLRAGSRFDPPKREGLAHLLEHLIMKRTKRFPNKIKRLESMEQKCIRYSAMTTKDPIYYLCLQEPSQTREALKILLDGFLNSTITQKDMEKEKKIVLDEINRKKGGSGSDIWKLANKGVWYGTRFEHEILGNEASLKRITTKDVQSFIENYYKLANLSFIILSPSRLDQEKTLVEIDKLKEEKKIDFTYKEFIKPKKYIVQKKKGNTVQLALTFLTKESKTDEEIIILRFIQNYLAGNWNSKLVQKLRLKESLTYWVNGYLKDYPDASFIRFIFSTKKDQLGTALRIFSEEINRLKEYEIVEKEIKKHIKMIKLRAILGAQHAESLFWYYGWRVIVYNRTPQSIQDHLTGLESPSPQEILDIAKRRLKNLSIAAIGDITKEDLTT